MIGISHQRSAGLVEAPCVQGEISARDTAFSPSLISFCKGGDKLY